MKARAGAAAIGVAAIWMVSSCTVAVTDLGGATSVAYGINRDGIVVGQSDLPGSSAGHAFKRLPDNTAVDLGTRPGDPASVAFDINDAGTVVGSSGGSAGSAVVLWDAANQITDLGFDALPRDINNEGVVVGHRYVVPGRDEGHAFVYDPAVGHPLALPELPGGFESHAWGLNDAGEVVGSVYIPDEDDPSDYVEAPVLWDLDAGTVTDLRSRTGEAFLNDIGDDGTIVGQSDRGRAAVWGPGSGTVEITTGDGVALGINDAGTVVGNGFGGGPFRWRADTGLVALGASGMSSSAYAIGENTGVVGTSGNKAAFLTERAGS